MTIDNVLNMNGAAKKLQILKYSCFTQFFNPTGQKIYRNSVSRWVSKIIDTNSVSNQMSLLSTWPEKCFCRMSQRGRPLTFWVYIFITSSSYSIGHLCEMLSKLVYDLLGYGQKHVIEVTVTLTFVQQNLFSSSLTPCGCLCQI